MCQKEKQSQATMKCPTKTPEKSERHPTADKLCLSTMVTEGRRRRSATPMFRPCQKRESWSLWPARLGRRRRGGWTGHRADVSRYVVHRFPFARWTFFQSAASAPLSRTLLSDIYLNRTNSSSWWAKSEMPISKRNTSINEGNLTNMPSNQKTPQFTSAQDLSNSTSKTK